MPCFRRLVAGLLPRRPGVDCRPVHVGCVVEKVALGQVPLRVIGVFFSCQYFSTNTPYSSSTCSYQKDKRAKHGNLPGSFGNGEHWMEMYFHCLGAFAEVVKVTFTFAVSARLSVHPHGTTRLPQHGYSWNLIFMYFSKFLENSNFIKIWHE